ncbi:PTS beta-glucoside transporter subunit EIIBCA [Listeria monocytogenes]|nr:PTS beta-glucoside transporter subunit EIIBCA [Listeria monocytogenes]EAK8466342.1 PTS beta-glucoside transporter subunit EIIBCA [Listeria monocytogenes]EDN7386645.1 PTS beta-glucoside transporter subunit EIIBCA [Listeria monocytogenes]
MALNTRELAEQILQLVGGKENIVTYTHCATRLRFILVDNKNAAKAKIENLKGVTAVVESGGQFQIVIGPQVLEVYKDLQHLYPLSDDAKVKKQKKGIMTRLIDILSSVFTPIIYVLAASGILKGLLELMKILGILGDKDGTYIIWSAAADAIFYFLPVVLAITAAKKFGANQFVAVLIGLTLLYPNMVAIKDAGVSLSFLNIPITMATFSGSVFPIIFAVALLAWLEKGLNRIFPSMIRNFFTPMFSLMILVPVTLLFFGPASAWLSEGISFVYTSLYGLSAGLAGAFVGFFFQIITMFGLHWGLLPISFANIDMFGYDTFGAFVAPTIVAQGGAAFGVFLKTKNSKLKEISSTAALISFFGISEASMYGTNIRFKRPFLIALSTSAVAAMIIGVFGCRGTTFVIPSVLSLPVFMSHNFLIFLIAYFGAFIVAALLTYLFGFNDKMLEDSSDEEVIVKDGEILTSPTSGEIVKLSDLKDQAFASGAVGEGIAIRPQNGEILCPSNGVVTTLFDSGHAIGITTDSGKELLIHIGIDTVKLQGKYFETLVKQGDEVQVNQLLLKFDKDKIAEASYSTDVIFIVTNLEEVETVTSLKSDSVVAGEQLLKIAKR